MRSLDSAVDVSAVINFHHEGLLAPASLKSFSRCCDEAKTRGLRVERIAVLDRPNALTRQLVDRGAFDRLEQVDFGDLGLSRNAATALARGRYVAFFDGDDLWGDAWLWKAARFADALRAPAICHPEYFYRFTARDFARQSQDEQPTPGVASHFIRHVDSSVIGFDARAILFGNLYSAHALAPRSVFARFPYRRVEPGRGVAIEDWAFNAETLGHGIRHAVVPDTVHLIREKDSGSLCREVMSAGYLPEMNVFAPMLWP